MMKMKEGTYMETNALLLQIARTLPNSLNNWFVFNEIPPKLLNYVSSMKNKKLILLAGAYQSNNICLYCLVNHHNKNKLVRLYLIKSKEKYKLIKYEKIHEKLPFANNFTSPSSESSRILNQAQSNLSGINYTPLAYSKYAHQHYYIALAEIQNLDKTKQLTLLHIRLNAKGHYEINHSVNLFDSSYLESCG